MLYTFIIYGEPGVYDQLPKEAQDDVLSGHRALQSDLDARGAYLSVQLMPPATAVTIEPGRDKTAPPLVLDGPYSETKECFLGIYAAEFETLEEALKHAELISSPIARIEVRPVAWAGGVISSDPDSVSLA